MELSYHLVKVLRRLIQKINKQDKTKRHNIDVLSTNKKLHLHLRSSYYVFVRIKYFIASCAK